MTITERGVLVVVLCGVLLALVGILNSPTGATVAGHATGLVVGVVAAVGERYVSVGDG